MDFSASLISIRACLNNIIRSYSPLSANDRPHASSLSLFDSMAGNLSVLQVLTIAKLARAGDLAKALLE